MGPAGSWLVLALLRAEALVGASAGAPLEQGRARRRLGDARPSYDELQDLVIEKLKLPVYVRKMREAGEKGPRFLR